MSDIKIGDTFRYDEAHVVVVAVGSPDDTFPVRDGEVGIQAASHADAMMLGWAPCTNGKYESITRLDEFLSIAERTTLASPTTPAPDHGPLAATLSDRTLAKVLSRPAYVPRETPSLVELDRREAAAGVRSTHAVTIDYNTGAPFPTLSFRCTAPAGDLCHAYYECSCEEWGQEGVIHGKPWHVDHEDVNHFGYWRNDECRLQDWFENSDEAVVGSVTVPVAVKYTGGGYEFDLTAVQS